MVEIYGDSLPYDHPRLTTLGSRIGHVVTCRSRRVSGLPWYAKVVHVRTCGHQDILGA